MQHNRHYGVQPCGIHGMRGCAIDCEGRVADWRQPLTDFEKRVGVVPIEPEGTAPGSLGSLEGEVAFFVDAGAEFCQRCGDRNFTERRVCLTCSGDPSGASFLARREGFVVSDRRRVR